MICEISIVHAKQLNLTSSTGLDLGSLSQVVSLQTAHSWANAGVLGKSAATLDSHSVTVKSAQLSLLESTLLIIREQNCCIFTFAVFSRTMA